MDDLTAKRAKLLLEADDCDLIGRLAASPHKRQLFQKLARDLRDMALDIERTITRHQAGVS